jgi:hypothetical protein
MIIVIIAMVGVIEVQIFVVSIRRAPSHVSLRAVFSVVVLFAFAPLCHLRLQTAVAARPPPRR